LRKLPPGYFFEILVGFFPDGPGSEAIAQDLELVDMLPHKLRGLGPEIVKVLRRHCAAGPLGDGRGAVDGKEIVKDLKAIGALAPTTYWRDVTYYRPIVERILGRPQNWNR